MPNVSIEQWVAIGLLVATVSSLGISIFTAQTSIRKSSFERLEGRVEKLEKRLKAALTANTKMRSIIQDAIEILGEFIETPSIPKMLRNKAHDIIEKAKKELMEAELLLVESITDAP